MKTIVLLLVISLGLVSAVNAESVCNSYSIKDIAAFDVGRHLSIFTTDDYKQEKYWDELVMRYYTSEIKKSDKETLCIYMGTIGQGYLNTQLTPQDIEQFERFLVEKGDEISYKSYELDKDKHLRVLKFFKYYNKLDILYSIKNIRISFSHRENLDLYDNDPGYGKLWLIADILITYKNEARLIVKRFVYDKNMGSPFSPFTLFSCDSWDAYCANSIKTLKKSDDKDAKAIAKWAETKLKESK